LSAPGSLVASDRGCLPVRGARRGEEAASYYSDALHGNATASGQPYDRTGFTAAHRTLPFGTHVRVTNLENGSSVVLRVNDRGPFIEGRVIDVSRRAAEALGFVRQGLVRVAVRVTDAPAGLE
jgi:rare lipoprotein A